MSAYQRNADFQRGGAESGGYTEERVSRPRARTVDGKEVALESYEAFKNDEILTRHAFETMLHGLSR